MVGVIIGWLKWTVKHFFGISERVQKSLITRIIRGLHRLEEKALLSKMSATASSPRHLLRSP
jgi:hypothetical protein